MKNVLNNILHYIFINKRQLAILIDPEKIKLNEVEPFVKRINRSVATYIFVGGSTVSEEVTEPLVEEIRKYSDIPVILFPGDVVQVTNQADAILFLSLISGRNPEYLIGKQVEAIPRLKETSLEVIPTGYILVENGVKTSVERVTGTAPMSTENIEQIVNTALAGELLGMKLMYLESGSGAKAPVSLDIVKAVKNELSIPLIVGGGLRTKEQMKEAFKAGANMVVVGTAVEENDDLLNDLKRW